MPILIQNLTKAYGDKLVLKDFSAELPLGETTVIMGPSGCGKTTLLNILLGFVQADSGTIENLPTKISAVFQEDRLCEDFSTLSNVTMVLTNPNQRPAEILGALGLCDVLHKPVRTLSGGMKRRVAIARALCFDGDLIILDEPFKGLDESTRLQVISVVQRETRGKTVIAVTHAPEEAALLSNHILRMEAHS